MANWFSQLRSVPAEKMQDATLTPEQMRLLGAIDFGKSSGDAWGSIGKEGVLRYMQDSLKKQYGTDDLSKFRFIEDASVPGGRRLDWEGRQKQPGLVGGLRDAGRSFGVTMGAGSGSGGDGLGGEFTAQNPSEALSFGATWEGKGGTGFNFFYDPTKPNGVGVRTAGLQTNDKGDIMSALAVLGAAFGAQALAGQSAAGGAAAGAAEGAATTGVLDLGGGLGMTAEGGITGATMAGGPGMSGAAVDAMISGGQLGGGMTSFGFVDPAYANMRVTAPGVITNNGVTTFGVMDPAARSMMSSQASQLGQAGAGGAAISGGGGGGAGGATPPATPAGGGLGSGSITGSKLGDAILTKGAGMALTSMLTPDAPDAPRPQASGKSPDSITKAVSEMPDPLEQRRARKRSLTEQLGRRGRASTIMTKPSGRLGG